MRIILLQDIKALGKKGDAKEVSEGYARNFLLPKNLAEVATPSALARVEETIKKEKERQEEKIKKMRELANLISQKKILIQVKEKKGKLFGSITPKQIISELEKENLSVLPSCVIIKQGIKKVGDYEVEIKLTESISAKLKLEIRGT